eukprot:TRINITY_DN10451_c0_g1_i1.p1 TRINITY_DN10451_c0_g1~~TRINITY_DN10451_c0_g1_i1.p1  ORF type:complete len:809 (+),score=134.40 TRINITY_DN10451_c0_g1_i1:53-2479(+)
MRYNHFPFGVRGLSANFSRLSHHRQSEPRDIPPLCRRAGNATSKSDESQKAINSRATDSAAAKMPRAAVDYTNSSESEDYIISMKNHHSRLELDGNLMKTMEQHRATLAKQYGFSSSDALRPSSFPQTNAVGSQRSNQTSNGGYSTNQTPYGPYSNGEVPNFEYGVLSETLVNVYWSAARQHLRNNRLPLAAKIKTEFKKTKPSANLLDDGEDRENQSSLVIIEELVIHIWDMLHYIFETKPIAPASGFHEKRLIAGVLSFLEKIQKEQILRTVGAGEQFGSLSSDYSSYDAISKFVRACVTLPSHQTDVEEYLMWSVLFYALRCGDESAALECALKLNPQSFDFQDTIKDYFANVQHSGLRSVSSDLQGRVEQFGRDSRNNPYRKGCINILAGRSVPPDNILPNIEDHIWYHLAINQSSRDGIIELQRMIEELLERGEGKEKGPLLKCFFYFLSLNFQRGLDLLRPVNSLYHHYSNLYIYLTERGAFSPEMAAVQQEYLERRNIYIMQLFKRNIKASIDYSFFLERSESINLIRTLFTDNQNMRDLVVLLLDQEYVATKYDKIGLIETYLFDLSISVIRGLEAIKDYEGVRVLCTEIYPINNLPLDKKALVAKALYKCLIPPMHEYNILDQIGKSHLRERIEDCVSLLQDAESSQESDSFHSLFSIILFYYFMDIYHHCYDIGDTTGQRKSAQHARKVLLEQIITPTTSTIVGGLPLTQDRQTQFDFQFKFMSEGSNHLSIVAFYFSEILRFLVSTCDDSSEEIIQYRQEAHSLSRMLTNTLYRASIQPQHHAGVVQNLHFVGVNTP